MKRSELQRRAPINRVGVKVKPPRRIHRPPRHHQLWLEAELISAGLAKAEARRMGCCQNPCCPDNWRHPEHLPGRPRVWQAHHVVFEQEVRRLGQPRWNTLNVLRLCNECHLHLHDGGPWKLPLVALRDNNYTYAFMLLEGRAYDYLHRHYAGEDKRLEDWHERTA